MSDAYIIDGHKVAADLYSELTEKLFILNNKHHIVPGLAVVLVGENPASEIYVRNKVRQAKELGVNSFEIRLPAEISQKHLIAKLEFLNHDPKIHGILVQLPLPPHLDEKALINIIDPAKDVDGFHVSNIGKLVTGQLDGLIPCTPLGCLKLIKTVQEDLTGMRALIIGRSNIVGKPMAHLLLNENCTVTIAHSKTRDIIEEVRQADLLVAAIGQPLFVKKDWLKKGVIVIDVGINRLVGPAKKRLVGDVDFEGAMQVAQAITPVPGGVGPMTIACLLSNTIKAVCQQKNIVLDE